MRSRLHERRHIHDGEITYAAPLLLRLRRQLPDVTAENSRYGAMAGYAGCHAATIPLRDTIPIDYAEDNIHMSERYDAGRHYWSQLMLPCWLLPC